MEVSLGNPRATSISLFAELPENAGECRVVTIEESIVKVQDKIPPTLILINVISYIHNVSRSV